MAENDRVIGLVNQAITQLCEKCDPNCARKFASGTLPHCYRNRSKFEQLQTTIIVDPLTDEEIDKLDGLLMPLAP